VSGAEQLLQIGTVPSAPPFLVNRDGSSRMRILMIKIGTRTHSRRLIDRFCRVNGIEKVLAVSQNNGLELQESAVVSNATKKSGQVLV
jgi:hypothetical protein